MGPPFLEFRSTPALTTFVTPTRRDYRSAVSRRQSESSFNNSDLVADFPIIFFRFWLRFQCDTSGIGLALDRNEL